MKNWTQPAIVAAIGELFIVFVLIFFPSANLAVGPKIYEQAQNHNDGSADKKDETASDMSLPFRLGKFLDDHNGAITALLTIVLAIYSKRMADLVYLQRRDAQEVSDRQAEETKEQLMIGKQSADAVRDAADAAMAAAGSERAWMSFDEVDFADFKDGYIGKNFVKAGIAVRVRWINKGRSPSIKCCTYICCNLLSIEELVPPLFLHQWPESQASAPVGPDLFVRTALIPVGESDRQDIYARKSALIVYAAVRYNEIFRSNIPRVSEVCLRIIFNGQEVVNGETKPMWDIAAFGPQNTAT